MLATFLAEHRSLTRVSRVVKRLRYRVVLVQRNWRAFMACRAARVDALARAWVRKANACEAAPLLHRGARARSAGRARTESFLGAEGSVVSAIGPHSSMYSSAYDAATAAAELEASEQLQQLQQLEENRRRVAAAAEAAAKKKAIARAVAEAREAGALKTERDRQIFWKSREVDAKVRNRLLLLLLTCTHLISFPCCIVPGPHLSLAGATARDTHGRGAAKVGEATEEAGRGES